MFGICGRPTGRLFLLLPVLAAMALAAMALAAMALAVMVLAATALGQGPPLTTIQDTVYRADGTPAQGTLLISWPGFTTASGQAVAAGSTNVTLGTGGALSVALVSNANATPVNSVYTVIYQLNDGTVKTEYWIVPGTSPANLAAVITTLGTSSAASQMVTQQYVNSALAAKANDSAVVHNSGNEIVSGVKQFSSPPSLPNPVNPNDGVNKQYVDNSVQNNGSGSYLSTAGGTMTGALLLSADPTSSGQAADKHYVDVQAAVKADLIAGLVPPSELGSGSAGESTCLLGNQTWGPCGLGGSGGSSYINSTLIANPDFNSFAPAAQNGFLDCSFQNAGSNVSLECPYGSTSSTFALGSQAVLNNQGNTYASGMQDFTAASVKLPSGAGYMPSATGAIGYDTTANMPVINVNGSTQQLALTTSNISGQASTALALAATPSQCNGSFATGVQANGNANCSQADVLELAETSAPNGIPNYGVFWFDSTTHSPRIIDNNGQPVQLGLLNVFNSDANTLQEYNGTNPQEFDLFGTRSDPSDYERLRLGYGIFSGSTYFFIGPDYAGSGQQRGLAFFTGTTPKWVIDGTSVFKPWTTNVYDIGSATQQVHNLYLGTSLIFGSGSLTGAHGTTGVAAEAGTLGTTTGAGLCNDGNGNVTDSGCSTGAVGSVFGRSGVVTAQSGDYSVSQVTGAAPLASPAFTGAPTTPTPATGDNSNDIATTAWVKNQNYGSGGGSVNGTAITPSSVSGEYFIDGATYTDTRAILATQGYKGGKINWLPASGSNVAFPQNSAGVFISPLTNVAAMGAPTVTIYVSSDSHCTGATYYLTPSQTLTVVQAEWDSADNLVWSGTTTVSVGAGTNCYVVSDAPLLVGGTKFSTGAEECASGACNPFVPTVQMSTGGQTALNPVNTGSTHAYNYTTATNGTTGTCPNPANTQPNGQGSCIQFGQLLPPPNVGLLAPNTELSLGSGNFSGCFINIPGSSHIHLMNRKGSILQRNIGCPNGIPYFNLWGRLMSGGSGTAGNVVSVRAAMIENAGPNTGQIISLSPAITSRVRSLLPTGSSRLRFPGHRS